MSSCMILIIYKRIKFGTIEEEQNHSCNLCNCCTFSEFYDLKQVPLLSNNPLPSWGLKLNTSPFGAFNPVIIVTRKINLNDVLTLSMLCFFS